MILGVDESKQVAPRQETALMSSDNFIATVLSQPDSAEKVQLLRELIAMKNAERERQAKDDFEAAFSRMRAELPTIRKTKEVRRSSGQHMYNYAPLEQIQKECDPILTRHGFSYSWREEAIDSGKRVWFDLMGYGFTKSNYFDAPLLGAKQSREGSEIVNAVQAARMTSSYAKRNSMVDGLGLIIEDEDDDARIEIDAELRKTLDSIHDAPDVNALMNIYKAAYSRYQGNQNELKLVVGEYNLAKQAIAKGAAK